jgi:hypothetical protein
VRAVLRGENSQGDVARWPHVAKPPHLRVLRTGYV